MEKLSFIDKSNFEKDFIDKVKKEYESTVTKFSEKDKSKKINSILSVLGILSTRLKSTNGFLYTEKQNCILQLKLARHFQHHGDLNVDILYEALIASPNFINKNKGHLNQVIKVYKEKKLIQIAKMRKIKTEETGGINPREALFETESHNYYLVRLLNMPHLLEESEILDHCVVDSDFYLKRMKRGEFEIFSLRPKVKINNQDDKPDIENPLVTIVYNCKEKIIEQIRKQGDSRIDGTENYYNDLLDALSKLRNTATDTGELRDYKIVDQKEFKNVPVSDYCFLTDQGEISYKSFDPNGENVVLKMGDMSIRPEMSKDISSKIIKVVKRIEINPDSIAYNSKDITKQTSVYIGKLEEGLFAKGLGKIEHVYTSFPKDEIQFREVEISGENMQEILHKLEEKKFYMPQVRDVLEKTNIDLTQSSQIVKVAELSVPDLNFDIEDGFTYTKVCERAMSYGLQLCSKETVFSYVVDFPVQKRYSSYNFGMESMVSDSENRYFAVTGNNDENFTFFIQEANQYFTVKDCITNDHKFIFEVPDVETVKYPELRDSVLTLKPFDLKDAEAHLLGEDNEQRKWLNYKPSTLESIQNWIKDNQESWEKGGPIFNFSIRSTENGELVGMIEANIDFKKFEGLKEGDANISYSLYPEARGKGYMGHALKLLEDFLKEKNIKRATIRILPENIKSLKVPISGGYSLIGEVKGKHREVFKLFSKELI